MEVKNIRSFNGISYLLCGKYTKNGAKQKSKTLKKEGYKYRIIKHKIKHFLPRCVYFLYISYK